MSDYKRIAFFDIDGCLSGIKFLCTGKGYIDPECCKIANRLKDYGVEVVISSSWGYDEGRTEKALRECGFELPIIGYTDHFYQDWLCRGNEIEKWLRTNFKGMCTKYGYDRDGEPYYRKHFREDDIDYEYVIFDDDTDMLLGQKDNFIRTDEQTGLTNEDIDKAIKILTRDNGI